MIRNETVISGSFCIFGPDFLFAIYFFTPNKCHHNENVSNGSVHDFLSVVSPGHIITEQPTLGTLIFSLQLSFL